MGGGLGMGDIHQLNENHQFILLLLAQVASIVSMFFLYRSSPNKEKKKLDGQPDDASQPTPPGN